MNYIKYYVSFLAISSLITFLEETYRKYRRAQRIGEQTFQHSETNHQAPFGKRRERMASRTVRDADWALIDVRYLCCAEQSRAILPTTRMQQNQTALSKSRTKTAARARSGTRSATRLRRPNWGLSGKVAAPKIVPIEGSSGRKCWNRKYASIVRPVWSRASAPALRPLFGTSIGFLIVIYDS